MLLLIFLIIAVGRQNPLAETQSGPYNVITVQICDDGSVPRVGQNYTVICNISDQNISDTIHQLLWKKNGTVLSRETFLFFNPLSLSDGGQYTCEVMGFPAVNSSVDINIQSERFS